MRKNELEMRLINFSGSIVNLCRQVPWNVINKPVISQIVRSSTSIGANYSEANQSGSYKDFRNKIYISIKELNETKYWIHILAKSNPDKKEQLRIIYNECQQLVKIFDSIIFKINQKSKRKK